MCDAIFLAYNGSRCLLFLLYFFKRTNLFSKLQHRQSSYSRTWRLFCSHGNHKCHSLWFLLAKMALIDLMVLASPSFFFFSYPYIQFCNNTPRQTVSIVWTLQRQQQALLIKSSTRLVTAISIHNKADLVIRWGPVLTSILPDVVPHQPYDCQHEGNKQNHASNLQNLLSLSL